jgi:hypothetical protein
MEDEWDWDRDEILDLGHHRRPAARPVRLPEPTAGLHATAEPEL